MNARTVTMGEICFVVAMVTWLPGCRVHPVTEESLRPTVTLTPRDRLLVLAPHPDDEILGCGGIIQQAVAMHLPVRVGIFTYGDNNQWSFIVYRKLPILTRGGVERMGLLRHDEAVAATKIVGLAPEQLLFFGYPDFGTMAIWKDHWGEQPPFRSMLTRATAVPYPNALRPGAPYKGEEIERDLLSVLREFRPTKIFVSHPGDYMPDHSALYLFTRVALWDVESEMQPALYPYLIHFKHWPIPFGYRPSEFLEPPRAFQRQIPWQSHRLTPEQVERKRAALRAHRTQYGYNARYLLSFVRSNELFGDFPVVTLRASSPPVALSSGETVPSVEPPEELTDEERAKFVGLEWRSVHLTGDHLIITIAFSRPLAQAVMASTYLFGYRSDSDFSRMPKVHIRLGALTYKVFDQDRELPHDSLHVTRRPKEITIDVPLTLLGVPRRVLVSARTYLAEVPLDWVSWRIFELPTAP